MTTKTAAEWVNSAIELGMDPQLVTQADGAQYVFARVPINRGAASPGLSKDLIDEVCKELSARGRIQIHCADPL